MWGFWVDFWIEQKRERDEQSPSASGNSFFLIFLDWLGDVLMRFLVVVVVAVLLGLSCH